MIVGFSGHTNDLTDLSRSGMRGWISKPAPASHLIDML